MKVVVLASLLVAVHGAACADGKTDGTDASKVADAKCTCGDDEEADACDIGKFCYKDAPKKKRCLDKVVCGSVDGKNVNDAACACGDSDVKHICNDGDVNAEKKFCLAAGTAEARCRKAVQCTNQNGQANADACSCGMDGQQCTAGQTCKEADDAEKKGTCADAKAAAKCTSEDGSAAAPAENCFCGGGAASADNPECKAADGGFCLKSAEGKFTCEAKKVEAKAAAKCTSEDGSAAAPAENCFCGGGAASADNPECKAADGGFCLKSAEGKFTCEAKKVEAKATATTTKAATTAAAAGAGTTAAAAAAALSPAAAEAAANAAYDLMLKTLVVDKAKVKATLTAGAAAAGAEVVGEPDVTGEGASAVMKVKAKIEDPTTMAAADKLKLDTWAASGMGIADVTMANVKYTKARRLEQGRQLAKADFNIEVSLKSKADYAAEKKKAAEDAQKTLSSGASAFGIAVAMGLVALY